MVEIQLDRDEFWPVYMECSSTSAGVKAQIPAELWAKHKMIMKEFDDVQDKLAALYVEACEREGQQP